MCDSLLDLDTSVEPRAFADVGGSRADSRKYRTEKQVVWEASTYVLQARLSVQSKLQVVKRRVKPTAKAWQWTLCRHYTIFDV